MYIMGSSQIRLGIVIWDQYDLQTDSFDTC